jgi:signal transduction histidine kinase
MVQLIGTLVCFAWSFGTGLLAFWLIKRFMPIRVSSHEEERGLNIGEYDDVLTWLDYRKTQRYENTLSMLNQLVDDRTKALQYEHDQLENILGSIADSLIVTSKEGHISLVNPAFQAMFESHIALVGEHINEVMGSKALGDLIRRAHSMTGETVRTSFIFRGRYYIANAHTTNEGADQVVTIIHDVARRTQSELPTERLEQTQA